MTNESLTTDESLAANGESFHWAKRFLGKKMGTEAAKLYAFCRLLDDMADGDIENGPARLVNIRAALIEGNTDADPALKSFSPLMEDQEFPLPVLIALIDGLLDDQREEVIFVDEAELLRYAYRVAGTVGLLMCHVLDCHDPDAKAHAIDLGIAMQLTNIARDVLEDAHMGRRYLPATWTGDISPKEIVAAANNPSGQHGQIITESVKRLLAMAEQFYASGAKGFPQLHWRAHMSIAIACCAPRQIAHTWPTPCSRRRRRAFPRGAARKALRGAMAMSTSTCIGIALLPALPNAGAAMCARKRAEIYTVTRGELQEQG